MAVPLGGGEVPRGSPAN